ncbi:MAG TPA: NAD(P)/FAD-dependent oxidoreductase [Mycobacteriales bacterium]|nr:NAD(P)/FAD-dependent oxidoreductase [Mycobacteriales bacterium]
MTDSSTDFDAIVVGAGIAGIYMTHKLSNELGLNVRTFERGAGVGGTWYWNRYPGAKSDSEGFVYRYTWDDETRPEIIGDNRYIDQDVMRRHLEDVVDRHGLGPHIQLNTGIEAAAYDEDRRVWTVTTEQGERFSARYLVTALGVLSTPYWPDIKGRDSFAGRLVHTAAWPEDLSVEGKRVGIIGTGSTGTQFICAASKTASHLTVFQRTAQYCVPSQNHPLTEEFRADYRQRHEEIWDKVRHSFLASGFQEAETLAMSVSPAERERVFQEVWDAGNSFRFMVGTFRDIISDPDANKAAADFIRAKIKEIVRDPETARKLMPSGYFARRPISNEDYYETYNQDNVSLVDIRENPISEITPAGVRTADGVEHELDILVFATGFDAVTGSYLRMDLRGRGGQTIQQHWRDGATSYLGIAVPNFPNMFMVYGPNTVFSNLPPAIETQVEWISDLVKAAEAGGITSVEATTEAETAWTAACEELAGHTLFAKVDSFINGGNIPGKKKQAFFFFAGLAGYRQKLKEVTDGGYTGFVLESSPELVRT